VPRVTWNRVNPPMKMSKMGATCQLRKDSKGTRVLRLVPLKRFRKSCEQTPSGFRVSEFLLLRLIETSEARSSEATVRDLPL
jgi:hypothetical protein